MDIVENVIPYGNVSVINKTNTDYENRRQVLFRW